jgi:hypothetical protein
LWYITPPLNAILCHSLTIIVNDLPQLAGNQLKRQGDLKYHASFYWLNVTKILEYCFGRFSAARGNCL